MLIDVFKEKLVLTYIKYSHCNYLNRDKYNVNNPFQVKCSKIFTAF